MITVTGGSKNQRKYAESMAAYCLKKFLPRHRTVNVEIKIKNFGKDDSYGYCLQEDNRNYEIEVNRTVCMRDFLTTVAHEMVHVKQYVRGELVGAGEEDLICSVTTPSTDLDGDPITYTYDWYVNGGSSQQTYANTTDLQDTYLASGVSLGIWTCAVTPNDGDDDGVAGEADIDAVARETCLDHYNSGFVTDGVYTLETANGTSFDVYCDMTNGGWALVASMGDPRLLPFLDNYLSTEQSPSLGQNWLHTNYVEILGTEVRVGEQIASGVNTGTVFQINDCDSGDAACWYSSYISQNDGDMFGAWIATGGSWNLVPSGCTSDQCPTSGGDRDHSQAFRLAIFGGDCHSNCNTGGNDTRNGFVYRDYGTSSSPSRIGNRAWWSDASTGGGTSLGVEIPNANYGQSGTEYRDIWIR